SEASRCSTVSVSHRLRTVCGGSGDLSQHDVQFLRRLTPSTLSVVPRLRTRAFPSGLQVVNDNLDVTLLVVDRLRLPLHFVGQHGESAEVVPDHVLAHSYSHSDGRTV